MAGGFALTASSGPSFRAIYAENADPWTAYLDAGVAGPVADAAARAPGDRFQPLGLGGHSARVNEFMINVKVPAAARGRLAGSRRRGGHRLGLRAARRRARGGRRSDTSESGK